ncbi:MFS transporter [Methanolobus sp. ZRKC5]|uniref:MFS transporter n=1 Tax=unclassified Methanolobus TaxID=2629569 RepID=UPI00313ADA34
MKNQAIDKNPISSSKLALPILLAASMITLMGGAAVAPALPKMGQYFSNLENAEYLLSFMVTLPSLAIALSSPFMGIIADKYGKKKLLIASLLLFSLSGVTGAYFDSLESILAGRFVLGIAIAGIMICATALITDYYADPAKRQKIYGMQAASMGFGGLILETGGGGLAEFSWRYPFFIYLIALPIMFGAFSLLEPAKHHTLVSKNETTYPKSKLKIGAIAFVYFIMFIAMVLMFTVPSKGPFLFTESGITSSLIGGILLGLLGMASMVAALCQVRISKYLDELMRCALGIGFTGLGLFLMANGSMATIVAGVVFAGIGTGVIQPTLIHWIGLLSPQHLRGRIFGGLTSILFLAQFVSPIIMQPLLGNGMSLASAFGYFGLAGVAMGIIIPAGNIVLRQSKNFTLGPNTDIVHLENAVYDEDE